MRKKKEQGIAKKRAKKAAFPVYASLASLYLIEWNKKQKDDHKQKLTFFLSIITIIGGGGADKKY
jgi:hypothetical protein